jgi:hypothetical protein
MGQGRCGRIWKKRRRYDKFARLKFAARHTPRETGEDVMAKGQQRQPKEKKKPKGEKDKPKQVSAYKAAFSGGGAPTVNPLTKK